MPGFGELMRNGYSAEVWEQVKPLLRAKRNQIEWVLFFAACTEFEDFDFLEKIAAEILSLKRLSSDERGALFAARGLCLARLLKVNEAKAALQQAISLPAGKELRIYISEYAANLVIMNRLMDYLPEVLQASETALRLEPNDISLHGTLWFHAD
ncbi:MAG: hypothetical protein QM796_08070 [Chthoniobacteraceae bacterium]